jgi:hypothetical protein
VLGTETLVVAALEDLGQVLHITQNITGMPSYKLKFFREVFLPLYRSKSEPDKKADEQEEKRIAVTTKQLCDHYKREKGKIATTNNLKKTYLNELLNNGYIDEEDSVLDKREKIYYPLVEFPDENDEGRQDHAKIRNCSTIGEVDNFMQYSKLILPKNCNNIPENWLKFEILGLMKYPLKTSKFALLDKDDNELCICRFENEYEKITKLSGYFSNIQNSNNLQKIFGDMKYLGKIEVRQYEKLSTQDEVKQFHISTADPASVKATSMNEVTNCIENGEEKQHENKPKPLQEQEEQQIPNSIYRLGHSDKWACKNCNVKDDKWFMLKHPRYCKAANQSKQNSNGGEMRVK